MDLRQLETALSLFSQLSPGGFPVHHAQVFLLVAAAGKGGTTYQALSEALNLTSASISRSCNALSARARHRKDAMGLLAINRDPEGTRSYRVTLSPRGRALARTIEAIPTRHEPDHEVFPEEDP